MKETNAPVILLRDNRVIDAIKIGKWLREKKKEIKNERGKWIEWFKKNYDLSTLRTAQCLMKISRVPSVEKYVELGMHRVLKLDTMSKHIKNSDPIGTLLSEKGIAVNSLEEIDILIGDKKPSKMKWI